jgi:hypothetical protein
MADPEQAVPPVCKRCGRFLRTEAEQKRTFCERCAPPADAPVNEERFCCGSDPPCPSCPYVVGWDE